MIEFRNILSQSTNYIRIQMWFFGLQRAARIRTQLVYQRNTSLNWLILIQKDIVNYVGRHLVISVRFSTMHQTNSFRQCRNVASNWIIF